MHRNSLGLAVAFAGAVTLTALANATGKYEVWAIDQSNSPGTTFGGTLYIWAGHDLENKHDASTAVPEKIDLGVPAAPLCLDRPGANPVRRHRTALNPIQPNGVMPFVLT